jgi:DNA polymerase-4
MSSASHVAHVWVDDFFVAVERQADASLATRPIVIGGAADSPARVVAASVDAMACGVVPGLRLRDAAALCPDAAFLPGRLDRVLDAASRVDETLRTVAGPVEWLAIDEAVLDLAHLDRVRAGRVAENLRSAVGDLGHAVAVGVADTRTAARVAARMARPQGILVVLPGYDARFLAGLAPACLAELDQAALQVLTAAGIETLGQLASMSLHDVFGLLGRVGPQVARRAAGEDSRHVRSTPKPTRLCRVHQFTGNASPADVADAAAALAEELGRALARFSCVARSISVRLEDACGTSLSRSADVAPATGQPRTLSRSAGSLLRRLSGVSPVRRLVLSVSQLSQAREQITLFDSPEWRPAVGSGRSRPSAARRPW